MLLAVLEIGNFELKAGTRASLKPIMNNITLNMYKTVLKSGTSFFFFIVQDAFSGATYG